MLSVVRSPVSVWLVQQRIVHHHLCVEPGVPRYEASQLPVVHVSPVHPVAVLTNSVRCLYDHKTRNSRPRRRT